MQENIEVHVVQPRIKWWFMLSNLSFWILGSWSSLLGRLDFFIQFIRSRSWNNPIFIILLIRLTDSQIISSLFMIYCI